MSSYSDIYCGIPHRLAVAFDIGPAVSSISYSIISCGQTPKIQNVTRYPGDERNSTNCRVPTVIYYDNDGCPRIIGAEAMRAPAIEIAEKEAWLELQGNWLLVRFVFPTDEGAEHPLPKGKTAVEALADFLVYMAQCASYFIQENHVFGMNLMRLLKEKIDYVFPAPQYWDTAEEKQIRQAFVAAGLIPDTVTGYKRISFVSQAQSIATSVFHEANLARALQKGHHVIVVDMNEEWTYIRCYKQIVMWNEKIYNESTQHILTPNTSIFENLHNYLQALLLESPYIGQIDHIVQSFQKSAMHTFSGVQEPHYIKFGSSQDNDPLRNIRYGQLQLPGAIVAGFYEYLLGWIFEYVSQQKLAVESTGARVSHLVLVGSLSDSEWIYKQLKAHFSKVLTVCRAESSINTVARGALMHYLKHILPETLAENEEGGQKL